MVAPGTQTEPKLDSYSIVLDEAHALQESLAFLATVLPKGRPARVYGKLYLMLMQMRTLVADEVERVER